MNVLRKIKQITYTFFLVNIVRLDQMISIQKVLLQKSITVS